MQTSKMQIRTTFAAVFNGLHQWWDVDGFEDRDDVFVFHIDLRGDDVARFFVRIGAIFPNSRVTIASDNIREGDLVRSIFMEIGIHCPE